MATAHSNSSPNVPLIKKELPSSPEATAHPSTQPSLPPSRHRPRRLDLSQNKNVPPGASTVGARPSNKDNVGLGVMHDVGIACLSPGFQSQDPSIQAQLQKSMDIREHQRRIIESQLHGKPSAPGGEKTTAEGPSLASAFSKPTNSSRRKGPPPGLAIHAPPAQQFAHEPRVIQSAPLHQTFTGLHPKQPSSLSRQVLDRAPPLGPGSSQLTQMPRPPQSSNRLPPISDVLDSARGPPSAFHALHSTYSPAHPGANASMASPGFPPPPASAGPQPLRSQPVTQPQPSSGESYGPPREREFKSAEEAVQSLSGGREELQPREVHYGGHQPPTPPSPRHIDTKPTPTSHPAPHYAPRSGSGRRRTREEYEQDLADGERMDIDGRELDWERRKAAATNRYAAWEEDRGRRVEHTSGPFRHRTHSPETNRRKKDEFMALCARAWDLLHS